MIFFLCRYSHHGIVRAICSFILLIQCSVFIPHLCLDLIPSLLIALPVSFPQVLLWATCISQKNNFSQLYPSTAFSCIKPKLCTATRYSFNKNLGILGKIEVFSFCFPQVHYFVTSAEVRTISAVHMDSSVGLQNCSLGTCLLNFGSLIWMIIVQLRHIE